MFESRSNRRSKDVRRWFVRCSNKIRTAVPPSFERPSEAHFVSYCPRSHAFDSTLHRHPFPPAVGQLFEPCSKCVRTLFESWSNLCSRVVRTAVESLSNRCSNHGSWKGSKSFELPIPAFFRNNVRTTFEQLSNHVRQGVRARFRTTVRTVRALFRTSVRRAFRLTKRPTPRQIPVQVRNAVRSSVRTVVRTRIRTPVRKLFETTFERCSNRVRNPFENVSNDGSNSCSNSSSKKGSKVQNTSSGRLSALVEPPKYGKTGAPL